MSTGKPGLKDWRVTFWFLTDMGWVQLGFAWLKARDDQHALSRAAQRALKLGFTVNSDTRIEVHQETGTTL